MNDGYRVLRFSSAGVGIVCDHPQGYQTTRGKKCAGTPAPNGFIMVSRMQEALFGSPSRLDRDLWLSRLADVLLDGIDVPATEGQSLYEWRDAVRTGSAKLLIKGERR